APSPGVGHVDEAVEVRGHVLGRGETGARLGAIEKVVSGARGRIIQLLDPVLAQIGGVQGAGSGRAPEQTTRVRERADARALLDFPGRVSMPRGARHSGVAAAAHVAVDPELKRTLLLAPGRLARDGDD